MTKIKFLFVFVKKLFFHNPAFRLDGKPIFQVYGPCFSHFCACFSIVFFGANFGVMHSKHRVWSAKYNTFWASGMLAHLEKSGFWVQNRRRKELIKKWLFNDLFLKSSPLLHRSSILGGFMSEQKWETNEFFCVSLNLCFLWFYVGIFSQLLMIFHNQSFCLNKTDF